MKLSRREKVSHKVSPEAWYVNHTEKSIHCGLFDRRSISNINEVTAIVKFGLFLPVDLVI